MGGEEWYGVGVTVGSEEWYGVGVQVAVVRSGME